jgi:hypothetical protein
MSLRLSLTRSGLAKAAAVIAAMIVAFRLGAWSRNSSDGMMKGWIEHLLPPPAAHEITIYADTTQPVVQLEAPRLIRASAKSRLESGESSRHHLTVDGRRSHCHSHIRAFHQATRPPHFHSAGQHKSHRCSRLQARRSANSSGRNS